MPEDAEAPIPATPSLPHEYFRGPNRDAPPGPVMTPWAAEMYAHVSSHGRPSVTSHRRRVGVPSLVFSLQYRRPGSTPGSTARQP